MLLQERAPGIGDLEDLFALHIPGNDQALVFQPLESRIDRAGGGGIATMHPFFKLFHHFVAMAGLFLNQFQNDVLHVPGLKPLPPTAAPLSPLAGAEREGEGVPTEAASHIGTHSL